MSAKDAIRAREQAKLRPIKPVKKTTKKKS